MASLIAIETTVRHVLCRVRVSFCDASERPCYSRCYMGLTTSRTGRSAVSPCLHTLYDDGNDGNDLGFNFRYLRGLFCGLLSTWGMTCQQFRIIRLLVNFYMHLGSIWHHGDVFSTRAMLLILLLVPIVLWLP